MSLPHNPMRATYHCIDFIVIILNKDSEVNHDYVGKAFSLCGKVKNI